MGSGQMRMTEFVGCSQMRMREGSEWDQVR